MDSALDSVRNYQRQRTLKQVQSTVGTRKGRGSGSMALRPKDSAAAHELMSPDASPNLRVWQMFEEAASFDGRLGTTRDLLGDFQAATDEFLVRLEPILRAPLPRVWDAVEGGLAEPTRATVSHHHAHTVGGDASIAGLEEARSDFHNRLRGHVIRPLEQWSEGLAAVEERLPELVRLRGRVVKASRNLARYNASYQKHLARENAAASGTMTAAATGGPAHRPGTGGGGGVRGLFTSCMHPRAGHGGISRRHDDEYGDDDEDDEVSEVDSEIARQVASEEAGMKLNYKHRKLDAARGDYGELEALVAGQLAGLARDAAWLKSYLVASLLLGKEAMQMAVVSLATTKQPLPGFTGRQPAPTVHGEMGINYDLAAAMPPPLPAVRHGQGSWGIQLLPGLTDRGVTAHKATASPLELSAVPEAQPLQPVTPVEVGATGIPLSAVADTDAGREYEAATGGPGGRGTVSGTGGGIADAVGDVAAGAGRDELRQQQQVSRMTYDSGMGAGTAGVQHEGWRSAGMKAASPALGGRGDLVREEGAGFRETEREGVRERGRGGGVMGAIAGAAEAVGLGGSRERREERREERLEREVDRDERRELRREERELQREGDVPVMMAGARDQDYRAHAAGTRGLAAAPASAADVGPVLRNDQEDVVCGRKEFREVEDRPIVRERVTKVLEHHPVEKQYETRLKYAGESALPGSVETVGAPETRVVETTPPGPKCPTSVTAY